MDRILSHTQVHQQGPERLKRFEIGRHNFYVASCREFTVEMTTAHEKQLN